jgi:hypothetical protein
MQSSDVGLHDKSGRGMDGEGEDGWFLAQRMRTKLSLLSVQLIPLPF